MIRKYKIEIIIGLIFFVSIFSLSIYMNYYLGTAKYFNVLFDIDSPRVVGDIVLQDFNHYRITVHPLLIIVIKPIYLFFNLAIRNPFITLSFIQSLLSSISLSFFYNILKKIIKNSRIIAFFTFLFAVNFAQIVFTISIETYIIAQFFLIIMWLFFIKKIDKELVYTDYFIWVLLGVGSISITLTNFFQFCIVSFFFLFKRKTIFKSMLKVLSVIVFSIILAEFLAEIQNMIWPTAPNFFSANILNFLNGNSEESLYISRNVNISSIVNVLNSNFAYLFYIFNLYKPGNGVYITFEYSKMSNTFSIICFLIFLLINIIYIIKMRKKVFGDKLYLSLITVYFFNFCLHLFYGNAICFLYMCHYNFIIICIIAYILDKITCLKNKIMYLLLFIIISILSLVKVGNMLQILRPYYTSIEYFRIIPIGIIVFAVMILLFISIKNKKVFLILCFCVVLLGFVFYKSINKKNTHSLTLFEQYEVKFNKYERQLKDLKNEYNIRTFSDYKEKMDVFFFGMASNFKLVYQDGKLYDYKTQEIKYTFEYDRELIIPNEYTVLLQNGNSITMIYENEKGIFINTNNKIENVYIRNNNINLPKFENKTYSEVLRVLNQEILFNIDGSEPKPNVFGYKQAYYRDAMLATMVLEETNNIDIIVPWVNNITKVYDNSRSENIDEADNIGELLYILGATKVNNKKLEDKILKEIESIKNDDNSISGMVDGVVQKYYPTVVALYGASKIGIDLDLTVPSIDDGYAKLTWYYEPIATNVTQESKYYPYINWAFFHYSPYGLLYILDEYYPLSYEGGEVIGDGKIESECFFSEYYCTNQVYVSHLWHASEMFLFINNL